MFQPEEFQILGEFKNIQINNSPKGRSNNRFKGNLFASIALTHINNVIPNGKYRLILGPLWIKGMEYIEWDGAIVAKDADETFEKYFDADKIVALFEFKCNGIYGGRKKGKGKTVEEVISYIKDNFSNAKTKCSNIKCLFYISLCERKPLASKKAKQPINYYEETRKLEPDITTCILFNSNSMKEGKTPEPLDEWKNITEKIKTL
jgi:hypothetical protein